MRRSNRCTTGRGSALRCENPVRVGSVRIGRGAGLTVIAGPCVMESRDLVLRIARRLKEMCERRGIGLIFKASYDKANRTRITSFRGPGLDVGLKWLSEVRRRYGIPVTTDVHSVPEAQAAGETVDLIQIPAFLCRQTDLLVAAARTQRAVNIKKGQFMAPQDMRYAVEKVVTSGNRRVLLTERGTCFGYNNLVTDFRAVAVMNQMGPPVVFDATHSVQQPGAGDGVSSGDARFAPLLARCAIAAGADALFLETHPRPARALSDGPNMIPLNRLPRLLNEWKRLYDTVKTLS